MQIVAFVDTSATYGGNYGKTIFTWVSIPSPENYFVPPFWNNLHKNHWIDLAQGSFSTQCSFDLTYNTKELLNPLVKMSLVLMQSSRLQTFKTFISAFQFFFRETDGFQHGLTVSALLAKICFQLFAENILWETRKLLEVLGHSFVSWIVNEKGLRVLYSRGNKDEFEKHFFEK